MEGFKNDLTQNLECLCREISERSAKFKGAGTSMKCIPQKDECKCGKSSVTHSRGYGPTCLDGQDAKIPESLQFTKDDSQPSKIRPRSGCSACDSCCHCEDQHYHHTEDKYTDQCEGLPPWYRSWPPDTCTLDDVTKDKSLKKEYKCRFPAPCRAACFDHPPKEEWQDVVPPSLNFAQRRETYSCNHK